MLLMIKTFGTTSNKTVEAAVLATVETVKGLPSIADIKDKISTIRSSNRIGLYQPLSAPRTREIPAHIKSAMNRVKAREWAMDEIEIPMAVVMYARQQFPDIADEQIRKNYQEILFAYENNQTETVNVGGISGVVVKPRMGLHIDKLTGIISAYVAM